MNDALITELFISRDERAVKELREKYGKLCLKISNNILSSAEDAEECVNSAYLNVWNSIPPARPDDLSAYVCAAVRNTAIKKLKYNLAEKRSQKLSVSLEELEECLYSAETTEDYAQTKELSEAINRFLRSQKETDRKIFIRRYWYTESVEEISEFFGMNKKTVATVLFRTRKKLKKYLTEEGFINE